MKRDERGMALLDVMAALAILGLAGLALVDLTAAHLRVTATAAAREHELWDEERLLAAHALLSAGDLDLRLGKRRTGDCVVEVQRPEPSLYRIAIARDASPDVEELVTVVYRRREDADAVP